MDLDLSPSTDDATGVATLDASIAIDITKQAQGFVPEASATVSEFKNAFDAFVLGITFQLRKADEEHDPTFILPGTYKTLITSAKVLAALVPHANTTDIIRVRGKALQFLTYERNMPLLLDADGKTIMGAPYKDRPAQPIRTTFIAKFIRKENQRKFMSALRYAMRALVDATDTALSKKV